MTPLWEWVVAVSSALTVALLGAAPLWWAQLREVYVAVLGRHGTNGLKREYTAFVAEYREKHDALATDMRQRFHDQRGEMHALGLALEERLRDVEKAVAVWQETSKPRSKR